MNATEPADVSLSQDAHGSMWWCRCQTVCVCACVCLLYLYSFFMRTTVNFRPSKWGHFVWSQFSKGTLFERIILQVKHIFHVVCTVVYLYRLWGCELPSYGEKSVFASV